MVLAMLIGAGCGPLWAQDIAGTWQGVLEAGKQQRILVKIARDAGGWQGVVYSLDSNMAYEGRATTQMSLQGADVRFAIAPVEASYVGKLTEDGAKLAGIWTQGGASYPLNLARVTEDVAWEIPKAGAAMAKDADPDWDVVTVKARDPNDPNGNASIGMKGSQFALINRTVETMLMAGYGVQKSQIVGAPHWIETEKWDVQGVPDVPGRPSLKQMQSLIRKVLAERFGLKLHRESRELSVYAITVAKGGEKMARSMGDPNGLPDESDNASNGLVTMRATNISMVDFAMMFQFYLDRPAVDQTGLTGRYDFQLKWTPDEARAAADSNAPPGMFTAIQEQIGLKLEPVKAPADVLVIDAVQRATGN
jgi:uncharacterized protein (TIGR03435 family)